MRLAALPQRSFPSLLLVLVIGSGCATHIKHLCHNISPSSTFITVESDPPGVKASFSDGRTITTPGRVVVRSDEKITVNFTKDGYQPEKVEIGPGFNYWFLGDLLAFPPIGFFVDAEQDAISRSYPSGIYVTMKSVARRGAAQPRAEAISGD